MFGPPLRADSGHSFQSFFGLAGMDEWRSGVFFGRLCYLYGDDDKLSHSKDPY